jgi:hypothetical protein
VRHEQPAAGIAVLLQFWNAAAALLAVAAGLLFSAGYNIAGAIAFALCAGGYALRKRASRR